MKIINHSIFILCIIMLLPFAIFSQNKSGYIIQNGEKVEGFVFAKEGFKPTEIFFSKTKGEDSRRLEPTDISEFFIAATGQTFVSKKIKDQRDLFFHKKEKNGNVIYFLYEKEGTKRYKDFDRKYLYEINKQGQVKNATKEELQEIVKMKCPSNERIYRMAKNKKKVLKWILARKECPQRVGVLKIGTVGSIDRSSYNNSYFAQGNTIDYSYHAGILMEVPLHASGRVSSLTEIRWNSFNYSNLGSPYPSDRPLDIQGDEYEYEVAISNIEVPILVRYYFSNNRFSPFIDVGTTYKYSYRLKDRVFSIAKSYQAIEVIEISEILADQDFLHKNNWDINIGVGARFFATSRFTIDSELRFSKDTTNSITNQLNRKGVELVISLSY